MPISVLFLAILLCTPTVATHARAETRDNGGSPAFSDDLAYRGLATALTKSSHYYEKAAEQIFDVCGQRRSGHDLSQSYNELISRLHEQTVADIDLFLAENFTACRATPLLVTGYYTPVLPGSLRPTPKYRFPLYAPPGQRQLRELSRSEIDTGARLKGHEIVYLADPVDLFFLHVQGSGIIALPDGSTRLASYAGDNGRPYTSIGKVLIQEGKLQRQEVSLATIRAYLTDHPEQRVRIFNHNQRYIFFRLDLPASSGLMPNGSLGYPLTAGRSVAMDGGHYPPGVLGILTGRTPHFDKSGAVVWQPLSRLVVHQDSGAAISGPHRLDLYMGSGQEAGQAAGLMKEHGSFAILIPNLSLRQVHSRIVTAKKLPEPEADAH